MLAYMWAYIYVYAIDSFCLKSSQAVVWHSIDTDWLIYILTDVSIQSVKLKGLALQDNNMTADLQMFTCCA